MKEVFVASPGSTPPRLLTHPSQPIAPTKINRPLPTNKLSLGLTNVEMLLKAGVEEEELADFLGLHLGAINSRGSIAGRGSISGWAGAKKRKMSLVGVEMSHSAERRGSRRASTKVNGKETTAKRSVGFKVRIVYRTFIIHNTHPPHPDTPLTPIHPYPLSLSHPRAQT